MPGHEHPHYLTPYREAVARHGATFEATLWRSRDAQRLRFDVLLELLGSDALRDATIVDAGCGKGDFGARLVERGVPFSAYVGVDGVPEMIELARERALPRCRFETGDFVADTGLFARLEPDVVFFSGSLNTIDESLAQTVVDRAFDASSQGVAFNFLGDRHHPRYDGEDLAPARRFDPVAWFEHALGLSSRVSLSQEYLDGHDVTLVIRHDGR